MEWKLWHKIKVGLKCMKGQIDVINGLVAGTICGILMSNSKIQPIFV